MKNICKEQSLWLISICLVLCALSLAACLDKFNSLQVLTFLVAEYFAPKGLKHSDESIQRHSATEENKLFVIALC